MTKSFSVEFLLLKDDSASSLCFKMLTASSSCIFREFVLIIGIMSLLLRISFVVLFFNLIYKICSICNHQGGGGIVRVVNIVKF